MAQLLYIEPALTPLETENQVFTRQMLNDCRTTIFTGSINSY